MKLTFLICLFLWAIPFCAFSQENERFHQELSQAWRSGNSLTLSNFFDERVQLSGTGKEGAYNKDQLQSVLGQFFENNQPVGFNLKHSGASHNGQIYLIGELETRSGRNYKVVCRAKSWQQSFRIFKLDLAEEF